MGFSSLFWESRLVGSKAEDAGEEVLPMPPQEANAIGNNRLGNRCFFITVAHSKKFAHIMRSRANMSREKR